jgi:hypothetical protein
LFLLLRVLLLQNYQNFKYLQTSAYFQKHEAFDHTSQEKENENFLDFFFGASFPIDEKR